MHSKLFKSYRLETVLLTKNIDREERGVNWVTIFSSSFVRSISKLLDPWRAPYTVPVCEPVLTYRKHKGHSKMDLSGGAYIFFYLPVCAPMPFSEAVAFQVSTHAIIYRWNIRMCWNTNFSIWTFKWKKNSAI